MEGPATAAPAGPEQKFKIPIYFEPNRGQYPGDAPYILGGTGARLQFRTDEVALTGQLRMKLVGGKTAGIQAEAPTGGASNYLIGNDAGRYITGIPQFARLRYGQVYPGIDMVIYGGPDGLEYDFAIEPGAAPSQIRLRFTRADSLEIDTGGNLRIRHADGEFVQKRPRAYQIRRGVQEKVDAAFTITPEGVGFTLGAYDPKIPLIIDPVLSYATYLGATSGYRSAMSMAVDSGGSVYLTGTVHESFPVTSGPLGTTSGSQPAFVVKLSPSGASIAFATFFGGSDFGGDEPNDIALDTSGAIYIAGLTRSRTFPVRNPLQATNGGNTDGFVLKINGSGNAILYGTYFGGPQDDDIRGLALDSAGGIAVTGSTTGAMPFSNPMRAYSGAGDAYFAKIAPSGAALSAGSYFGGSNLDIARAVALDSAGNVFIAGDTYSTDFPLVNPRYSTSDRSTAFVAKFTANGASAVFSTLIPASTGNAIAVDAVGRAFVTGGTCSDAYQVTAATVFPFPGTCNAYIAAYQSDGQYHYTTKWGGGAGTDITVDAAGNAAVTGNTWSSEAEKSLLDPIQSLLGTAPQGTSPQDSFAVRLDSSGTVVFATLLGGNHVDLGQAVAVTGSDLYIAGWTWSTLFPATQGAHRTALQSTWDMFVAKISLNATSCSYLISPPLIRISATGASQSLPLATAATCNWTAESRSDWINLTPAPRGRGPAQVAFAVAANPQTRGRIGGVSLPRGGIIVLQDGAEGSCAPPQPLIANQPVIGQLQPGDCTSLLNSVASRADHYTFQGRGGDMLSISLSSSVLDPILYLYGPEGAWVDANDDIDDGSCTYFPPACNITGASNCTRRCRGGDRNSRIPVSGRLRLPRDGTYFLEATSFSDASTGAYVLSLDTLGSQPPAAPGPPTPADGATGVAVNTSVSWPAVSGATSYEVYFGNIDTGQSLAAAVNTPAYNPGSLAPGATYTWRVVARNAAGFANSASWRFTTQGTLVPPTAPANPSPPDGAANVPTSVSLSWSAGLNATSYDIYFGASASPQYLANTTATGYNPGNLLAGATYYWRVASRNGNVTVSSPTWRFTTAGSAAPPGLRFVPVAPCRVADTRAGQGMTGNFGPPTLDGNTTRQLPIPSGRCGIPATAQAYSFNVTVVPAEPLGYLSLWPTGQPQPAVSTLNSFHGGVVANAAIVPAGTGGSISVFVTNRADVILDINGYFEAAGTYSFYALDPCRLADTRQGSGFAGSFGPPIPAANSIRTFPVPSGNCGVPANAAAYSLNLTVLPAVALAYLTVWPTAQTQPFVSTLNSFDGAVVANAAIVPAGAGGAVNTFVTDAAEIVIDTNGYFGAAGGAGELRFFPVPPCRAADTRLAGNGAPVMAASETREFVLAGKCGAPQGAKAFAVNVTVAPNGPLGFLTMWPSGKNMPLVSTLNSFLGRVVANAAIVPAGTNGGVNVFVTNQTHVILDVNGYFQ